MIRILCVVLLLTGCASLRGKQYKCQNNTKRWVVYHESKGRSVRIGHGWYKDSPHRWTEVYENGRWLLCRDTIRNYGGWPVEAYGDYKVRRYEYPK